MTGTSWRPRSDRQPPPPTSNFRLFLPTCWPRPCAGGASRLATQQACPFRAQAQWRLGAQPPAMSSAGVPPSVRGQLLHLLLQHFWGEVQGHAGLMAMDAPAGQELLERSWAAAVRATRAAGWLPPTVLDRERARAIELVAARADAGAGPCAVFRRGARACRRLERRGCAPVAAHRSHRPCEWRGRCSSTTRAARRRASPCTKASCNPCSWPSMPRHWRSRDSP